jgi:hypothetical protein
MPSLADHQSAEFVKLLLLGDAKSGKTTSLKSLVAAGYKLRILDMDNLLDSLAHFVREECPEMLQNVEFRTLRDKRKMTAQGPIISGPPKAFVDAIKMMDHWKYTTEEGTEVDLGHPSEWGPECILVLDSLSRFCDAAYDFREPMAIKGTSGQYDARAVYGDAQDAVETTIATLTGPQFQTNVIVVCHGLYMDQQDGTTKLFPQGVGQKLSPKIPQYFPTYVRYKNEGGKRTIQLKSDHMIDLAMPRPIEEKTLPADTGLATLFDLLRQPVEEAKPTEVKPKAQLRKV